MGEARSFRRLIPFRDNISRVIPKNVTNRAWVGTNRVFWDESGAPLGRIGRAGRGGDGGETP